MAPSFCAVTWPNSSGRMSSVSPCTTSAFVRVAADGSGIIGDGYMSLMGRYELSANTPPRLIPGPNAFAPCSAAVSATAPPWLNPPRTIFSGAMPSFATSSCTMPVTNCADWSTRVWSSTKSSIELVNLSMSYHDGIIRPPSTVTGMTGASGKIHLTPGSLIRLAAMPTPSTPRACPPSPCRKMTAASARAFPGGFTTKGSGYSSLGSAPPVIVGRSYPSPRQTHAVTTRTSAAGMAIRAALCT
mmetsp:Transcript_2770/g.10883  ORF Transcript_2770/g.10883 Transcript_2770/m.10883 type:complete len:244 (-) Transcript_2770:280-1011(-)